MNWIKRNLGFVIGGGIALLLLAASLFYIWQGMSRNSAALTQLQEVHGKLQQLTTQKPGPGSEKVNNTQTAKEQEKQLRDWIAQAEVYFQPIAPVPTNSPVSSESFASALRITIDQLQRETEAANVALPPRYGFSFEAERSLVRFAPEGLPALATQLGEVKTISEIFFASRVNGLDAIQRLHVSPDDTTGPQGDYFEAQPATGDGMTVTPYIITFRSFGSEIAQVLANFAHSPNGFVVKIIGVQPASAAPITATAMGAGGSAYRGEGEGRMTPPPVSPTPGGTQASLKEQILRITMEVDIVKLQPKS